MHNPSLNSIPCDNNADAFRRKDDMRRAVFISKYVFNWNEKLGQWLKEIGMQNLFEMDYERHGFYCLTKQCELLV